MDLNKRTLEEITNAVKASTWGEVHITDGTKTGFATIQFGQLVFTLA